MKTTLMMHEAAADSGSNVNVEGAWGDTEAVGKVTGGTEGEVVGSSRGWIDVAAEVSERLQLWPPSWECC